MILWMIACVPEAPIELPDVRVTVVINEILASNAGSNPDEHGEYDDWLELYNDSDEVVPLAGFTLTNDLMEPDKDTLPADLAIPAHGWLVLWADDTPEQGSAHLEFNLDRSTGELGLYDESGRALDLVVWLEQATDRSAARVPDGSDQWEITEPSPRAANE